MKKVPMTIEEMKGAREALNNAFQHAMMIMSQKDVSEASVSLKVDISIEDRGPKMNYKTTIRVPMEVKDQGTAANATQIYWDDRLLTYVMEIPGEQVEMG